MQIGNSPNGVQMATLLHINISLDGVNLDMDKHRYHTASISLITSQCVAVHCVTLELRMKSINAVAY
jgi:hypothetical protein